ncbi:hypothetical protein VTN49DRAFT_5534 [Thermomyces lanuginosus]|uniref:uncharacterized protein n=1 Tax=Thermomyces lanuginosus TaxID=5541 RepID=UPI0037443090
MSPVGLGGVLFARDVGDVGAEVASAPETFSSWDKCMEKTYCKWPVIAGIIVGSIILLSLAACLISCICCGYQCCRSCCGCCYDCCDCCVPSRHKNSGASKHSPPPGPYYQQPAPPPPMQYGTAPGPKAPPAYRGATVAQFDTTPKPVSEDSLPAMPTWADARTRRVEDTSPPPQETVEMNNLDPRPSDGYGHEHGGAVPVTGRQGRGGYTELPGNGLTPPASPHAAYNINDGPAPYDQHAGRPSPRRSPGPPSPSYAPMPSPSSYYGPQRSPEPYRGMENQSPPQSAGASQQQRVPKFNSPRAYETLHSPSRSPTTSSPPYDLPAPQSAQPQYAPPQHTPQQYEAYSPYSPAGTTLEPTPEEPADRPPSVLMAGRRPTPNSVRHV